MTDHPNTDPAYLVPAGLPAEPAKCPACGGTGCPYCGGPEADYHTACFDCPACGGTGQAPAEEAAARLTSAERVVRRLLQHGDLAPAAAWRLALEQAVRDAETAAQALDLVRKMTEE